ncbi:hypothetical protein BpHYR1_002071 [Brachionus plicatilis]|uniref:Uncharacterized protein n=1 Tax=Brachionus plicatilis TaxID=10195 RepID=A0A3M7QYY7_BRAPC|nr:hypothetical protein BpHYR1_002071 [Brachionus plicatilis]
MTKIRSGKTKRGRKANDAKALLLFFKKRSKVSYQKFQEKLTNSQPTAVEVIRFAQFYSSLDFILFRVISIY